MANPELVEQYREETREIIAEILQDGSDPDALYLIEHHLCCQHANKLEQLIEEAFRLGYEMDEPEEMALDDGSIVMCCDLMVESPLNAEIIDDQVNQILTLTEKYQVDYDGWGTWYEDPDGEDEDDEDEDNQDATPQSDDNGVRH